MKAIVVRSKFGPIILFPEFSATPNPEDMMSWDPNGGHSAASEKWALEQRLANDNETNVLIDLYKGLHGVTEDVKVLRSLGSIKKYHKTRSNELLSIFSNV